MTKYELADFLAERFHLDLEDDFDRFQVEETIYWFASDHHSGQTSDLYRILCQSEYEPGLTMRPERMDMYQAMADHFFPLSPEMIENIEGIANSARKAGQYVEINPYIPTIAIYRGEGDEIFLQEYEAQELLDSVPSSVSEEDYILYVAQGC